MSSLVNYNPCTVLPSQDSNPCGYCKDELSNGEAVVEHDGHCAIHKDCLIDLIANWRANCPICEKGINKDSLLSWKEKSIIKIKSALNESSKELVEIGIGEMIKNSFFLILPSKHLIDIDPRVTLIAATILAAIRGAILSKNNVTKIEFVIASIIAIPEAILMADQAYRVHPLALITASFAGVVFGDFMGKLLRQPN